MPTDLKSSLLSTHVHPRKYLNDPAIKNRQITGQPKTAQEKEKKKIAADKNDAHAKEKETAISSAGHDSAVPVSPVLNYPAVPDSAVLNYSAVQDSAIQASASLHYSAVQDTAVPAFVDLDYELPEFFVLKEKLIDAKEPRATIVVNANTYYKLPSDFLVISSDLRERLSAAARYNNCTYRHPLHVIPTHSLSILTNAWAQPPSTCCEA